MRRSHSSAAAAAAAAAAAVVLTWLSMIGNFYYLADAETTAATAENAVRKAALSFFSYF